MLIEKILLLTGSFILLVLGGLHLYYTFFSRKFFPKNPNTEIEMKNTSPRVTKETTLWNAWIGFNASHSLGAIFFGLINLTLVITLFNVLRESIALQVIDTFTLLFYLFLAKRYWFKIPLTGILISSLCFIVTFILFHLQTNL